MCVLDKERERKDSGVPGEAERAKVYTQVGDTQRHIKPTQLVQWFAGILRGVGETQRTHELTQCSDPLRRYRS